MIYRKWDSPIVTVAADGTGVSNQVRREPLWLRLGRSRQLALDFYTTGVRPFDHLVAVIVCRGARTIQPKPRWERMLKMLLLVGVVWWVTLLGNFQDDVWRSAIGLFEGGANRGYDCVSDLAAR